MGVASVSAEIRKWWALGAVTLAVLAAGLDATVLSVALPTLAGALRATETDLQWFASAYLLAMSAGMLPMGSIGDRFGRRRTLMASLALFAAGSLACALSPSAGFFIVGRVVLGIASAGLIVMALSAITVLFDEAERPRAVGVWSVANFVALPIGPVAGGWLLTHAWWGWVFLMNIPVALLGLVVSSVLVPESRSPHARRLDLTGMLLGSAGLSAVTYALINAGREGWTAGPTLAWAAAGILLLAAFGAWEARLARRPGGEPVVDLHLFRSRAFAWGTILAAVGVLAMFSVLFTMPQYFQAIAGADAMGSGVRLMPLVFGLIAGALPADRVAGRSGPRAAVSLGFLIMAASLLAGVATGAGTDPWAVAAWMAGVGAGMGLALATAASGALAELDAERSGAGAAVMQALQKLGGPFGSAIMGSVLHSVYRSHLALGAIPPAARSVVEGSVFGGLAVAGRLHSQQLTDSVRAAFVAGMDASLVASAGVAIAGLILALAFMPHRSVQRMAGRKEPVGAPV